MNSNSKNLFRRISIIVAVYNGATTIQKLFDSLRPQKAAEVELIVVDGVSTDTTMEIVSQNADLVDHVVSESDTGIYNAWNKGLRMAAGEWISFIGSDDWYVEGAIAAYLESAVSARDDTDLISSRVRYHAAFGNPVLIGRSWQWPAFQRHMTIAHVGALHRRRLYDRVGHYDESYRICGDYELLLRAQEGLRTEFLDRVTAEMGGAGLSNNQLAQTYEESARARRDTGGRSSWRTAIERPYDHFRARLKRLLQFA